MPGCWFILLRYTLRVDNVLFRTYDTRIFHSFASSPPTIIREISGWEAPYASVQRASTVHHTHFVAMLPALSASPQIRRFDPFDRPGLHSEGLGRIAESYDSKNRSANWLARDGQQERSRQAHFLAYSTIDFKFRVLRDRPGGHSHFWYSRIDNVYQYNHELVNKYKASGKAKERKVWYHISFASRFACET